MEEKKDLEEILNLVYHLHLEPEIKQYILSILPSIWEYPLPTRNKNRKYFISAVDFSFIYGKWITYVQSVEKEFDTVETFFNHAVIEAFRFVYHQSIVIEFFKYLKNENFIRLSQKNNIVKIFIPAELEIETVKRCAFEIFKNDVIEFS